MSYERFARLADLHRSLVGQVDQKVGHEKAVMRKYIAAIERRLRVLSSGTTYYVRWRRETGEGSR